MALKRVLAEDIISPVNVPHDTNAAMDGYAFISTDLNTDGPTTLCRAHTSLAGSPYVGEIKNGECVRIFTGAVMPDNADSVVMQEYTTEETGTVTIAAGQRANRFVRFAGDDLPKNAVALTKGKLLTPTDIGLIASLGIGEIKVTRKPVVAFFSTGDELRSVGQALSAGDVYDSNRYTLFGFAERIKRQYARSGCGARYTCCYQKRVGNGISKCRCCGFYSGCIRRRCRFYKTESG